MQLCDAHGLPLITLCDTPGMMVGPEVEETALVRHCSRLFLTGANLRLAQVIPQQANMVAKSEIGLVLYLACPKYEQIRQPVIGFA